MRYKRPAEVYKRWPQIRDSVDLVTGKRQARTAAEEEKLRSGDARVCLLLQHGCSIYNKSGTPYWQSLWVSKERLPKERCKRGHWFTPENTRYGPSGRQCRICNNDLSRIRRARAKKRAEVREKMSEWLT